MRILAVILAIALDVIPSGSAFVKQLQQRDSILVADQLEYGFRLEGVQAGTELAMPDFSGLSNDTLFVVRNWQADTLTKNRVIEKSGKMDISVSMILAPFEEGTYQLPPIPVQRTCGNKVDTLLFEAQTVEVFTMPVDTATFEIHDIKGQIRYPVTPQEVAPWVIALKILIAIIGAVIILSWALRKRRNGALSGQNSDPAHIVALRELDKYRSDKYWAPDKQKQFYSGITDALKNYIDARYGVDAPEMTTAELFDSLKGEKSLTPELYAGLKDLFETADFVKFAKHVASDQDNAKALPLAVRFVTETYQSEIEQDNPAAGGEAAGR